MTAQVRELPTATANITTEIVKVTPPMAEKWLGRNVKNRSLRHKLVDKYARAMTRGEWIITGEAVKFAVDGTLLDGQHRLAAIVQSGRTVQLLVVKGLPAETQNVMDTGRARTVGDQLGIAGYVDPNLLAATARVYIQWRSGLLAKDAAVSTPETMELTEGNGLLAHAVARGRTVSRSCDLRPSVAAMTYYVLLGIDDAAATKFFDRLNDGVDLPSGSPILALRARLRALRDERTRLPNEVLISLVFRTWNKWRSRGSLVSLPLYKNGQFIPCPEPK